MKFLSGRTLQILGNTIRLTKAFRVTPFGWNGVLEQVEVGSRPTCLVPIFFLFYEAFLVIRFGQSLLSARHGFTMYAIQACTIMAYFVLLILVVSFSLNSKEWVVFMNHQIQLCKGVEGTLTDILKPFLLIRFPIEKNTKRML